MLTIKVKAVGYIVIIVAIILLLLSLCTAALCPVTCSHKFISVQTVSQNNLWQVETVAAAAVSEQGS